MGYLDRQSPGILVYACRIMFLFCEMSVAEINAAIIMMNEERRRNEHQRSITETLGYTTQGAK